MDILIGTTITIFGTGSYSGTIVEQSENHIFIKDDYGNLDIYEKKDVKTDDNFTTWNFMNHKYAVDPKDSVLWKFYHNLKDKIKETK